MKIKLGVLSTLFLVILSFNCSSDEVQDSPAEDEAAKAAALKKLAASNKATEANEKLNAMTVANFGGCMKTLSNYEYSSWSKTALPVLKDIADNLPAGYKIVISGYANRIKSGPKCPAKYGVNNIRLQRATFMRDKLVKDGIPADKITINTTKTDPLFEGYNGQNRRVSFSVAKE